MNNEEEPLPRDWHRRANPDGSLGGWVHKTTQVDATAYIGPSAHIAPGGSIAANMRVEDGEIYIRGTLIPPPTTPSSHGKQAKAAQAVAKL